MSDHKTRTAVKVDNLQGSPVCCERISMTTGHLHIVVEPMYGQVISPHEATHIEAAMRKIASADDEPQAVPMTEEMRKNLPRILQDLEELEAACGASICGCGRLGCPISACIIRRQMAAAGSEVSDG